MAVAVEASDGAPDVPWLPVAAAVTMPFDETVQEACVPPGTGIGTDAVIVVVVLSALAMMGAPPDGVTKRPAAAPGNQLAT